MEDNISHRVSTTKIQLITRRVNTNKLSQNDPENYYRNLKHGIKKVLNKEAEVVMIQFIPDKPISDRYVLKVLLMLQREFTPLLIMPSNNEVQIGEKEIEELSNKFNASALMIGV